MRHPHCGGSASLKGRRASQTIKEMRTEGHDAVVPVQRVCQKRANSRTVNLSILGRFRRFSDRRLAVPYRHGPLVPIAAGGEDVRGLFGAIDIAGPDCGHPRAGVARGLVAKGCEEVAKHVETSPTGPYAPAIQS